MNKRVKHDESNYVGEVHDNGLSVAQREIFLHSIFDTEESGTDSEEPTAEPDEEPTTGAGEPTTGPKSFR